jgi:biotin carboxyl carrier protein
MKKIIIDDLDTEKFEVTIDGEKFQVEVKIPEKFCNSNNNQLINNPTHKNPPQTNNIPVSEPTPDKEEQIIFAPMPGNIKEYKKNVGDKVNQGEVVIIFEAMKMYNNLYSPVSGIIKEISFTNGDNVKKYDILCKIKI